MTPAPTPLHDLVIECGFTIAAFLVVYALLRSRNRTLDLSAILARTSAKARLAPLVIFATALLGRALLMPCLGIPQAHINDEFSYLLAADTFAHFRLANPTPAAWEHFETFHVNMGPTYHSKYPAAQGLTLALGEIPFRQPWFGVYLSTALLCGAICWALQAFLPPPWPLLAGLLAIVRIALFGYWMNSYWGGSVAALGGAMAMGAVVRLFQEGRSARNRAALALCFSFSLLILATSRPFEGFAYSVPLLLFFGYRFLRSEISGAILVRFVLLPFISVGLLGVALMGYYNLKTTGNAFLMPYVLNERIYSPLPLFIGQPPKQVPVVRHDAINNFWAQVTEENYDKTRSLRGIVGVEIHRLMLSWWFYVGPALSFPVFLGVLSCISQQRLRLVVYSALSVCAAVAVSLYYQPHYLAATTVAVYLFAAEGLRYLWDTKSEINRALVIAFYCAAIIAALSLKTGASTMYMSFRYGEARERVSNDLARKPGRHLVLVSYEAKHYPGDEVVHNGADFGSEKILWARSMGKAKDAELCATYSDRTFWSLTTDDVNVSLRPVDLCEPSPASHLQPVVSGAK